MAENAFQCPNCKRYLISYGGDAAKYIGIRMKMFLIEKGSGKLACKCSSCGEVVKLSEELDKLLRKSLYLAVDKN